VEDTRLLYSRECSTIDLQLTIWTLRDLLILFFLPFWRRGGGRGTVDFFGVEVKAVEKETSLPVVWFNAEVCRENSIESRLGDGFVELMKWQ
jgi:hypothetical protein